MRVGRVAGSCRVAAAVMGAAPSRGGARRGGRERSESVPWELLAAGSWLRPAGVTAGRTCEMCGVRPGALSAAGTIVAAAATAAGLKAKRWM